MTTSHCSPDTEVPDAWQFRFKRWTGEWSDWQTLHGNDLEYRNPDYEYRPLYSRAGVAQSIAPVDFFSENVDAWGAAEWFNRLAIAIRQQDAAVLAKDEAIMEICRNVAASSAMRLVRGYEQQVRSALTSVSSNPYP